MNGAVIKSAGLYHYRDDYFLDVVYDQPGKAYEEWLYNPRVGKSMFVRRIKDDTHGQVRYALKSGVESFIREYDKIYAKAV